MEMSFTIVMDREIDTNRHYISPGGYEFAFPNGTSIQFDFIAYYGNVNKQNRTLLDCEVEEFDHAAFGYDAEDDLRELFEQYKTSEIEIVEFFVYTGEADDAEIDAIMVKDLVVTIGNKEYRFEDFEL